MDRLPSVDDAAAALDRIIERAIEAGEGVRAAEAGVVLGAILAKSGTGGARLWRAVDALQLANDVEGPLAMRAAWVDPG